MRRCAELVLHSLEVSTSTPERPLQHTRTETGLQTLLQDVHAPFVLVSGRCPKPARFFSYTTSPLPASASAPIFAPAILPCWPHSSSLPSLIDRQAGSQKTGMALATAAAAAAGPGGLNRGVVGGDGGT